jgi:DNA-binding MarR family transcriptional regulator
MTRQEAVTKIIESGITGEPHLYTQNKVALEEYVRADKDLDPVERFIIIYILESKINLCIDAWIDMAQTLYISVDRLKRMVSSLEDRGYIITGKLNVGRMTFRAVNPRLIERIANKKLA